VGKKRRRGSQKKKNKMDYTEEQIRNKFESLPKDVRAAMESTDIDSRVTELAKKYRLHIDKAEELSDETGLVMLGLTRPENYLKNIRRRLELPEDVAHLLVADVNEQIFKPIRESLKSIHGLAAERRQASGNAEQPIPQTNEYRETITEEDLKILSDHGMELVTDNGGEPPAPSPVEPAERPENRIEITKEDELPKKEVVPPKNIPPAAPVPSPSEKLTSTTKTPPTEATYTPIKTAEQPATKDKSSSKSSPDPYREAIS
jgi:hypothetical protein